MAYSGPVLLFRSCRRIKAILGFMNSTTRLVSGYCMPPVYKSVPSMKTPFFLEIESSVTSAFHHIYYEKPSFPRWQRALISSISSESRRNVKTFTDQCFRVAGTIVLRSRNTPNMLVLIGSLRSDCSLRFLPGKLSEDVD